MLRLFVNKLTADDKYSLIDMLNFSKEFQTPLSLKQKTFCRFLIAFLKYAWNLEHFQEKDQYASLIISGVIDCEKRGYINV